MPTESSARESGKRALVHIGTNKTGTTAIQESLARAAKDDKLAGIAFPMLPGYTQKVATNHNFFRVLYRPVSELSRRFTYPTDTPEADRDRDVLAFRAALADAVAENDRFIFSGEFLSTLTPEEIEAFHHELFELGITEITPVIYIREPVSRYLSSVQQRIKASSTVPHPARYRDGALKILRNWHRAFPNLIVRPFDRAQLREGDVVADFLHVVSEHFGTDLTESKIESVSSNESISAEGMLILQQYRERFHSERDNIYQEDSSELIRQLVRSKGAVSQTRPKLSTSAQQTIAANHVEHLKELRAIYGIEYGAVIDAGEVAAASDKSTERYIDLADILEDYDPEIVNELTLWLLNENLKALLSQRNEIADLRKSEAKWRKRAQAPATTPQQGRRSSRRRFMSRSKTR